MNTNAELRKFTSARPYRPFFIQTIDGQTYEVPHSEFIAIPPQSTDRHQPYFYVFDEDGSAWHINPMMVSRIALLKDDGARPEMKRPRRKAS